MKAAELRSKSKDELKDLVLNLKKEQFNLRMQAATGSLENASRVKDVRKTIARAKTLLNETPEAAAKVAAKPAAKKTAAKKPAAKTKKG
ncbi:MAG: 50S ribosomal protein L29 [Proteobacteria bacterium]|nr:50S ribosomal protein L29 [Pseudomonadota bacterium]